MRMNARHSPFLEKCIGISLDNASHGDLMIVLLSRSMNMFSSFCLFCEANPFTNSISPFHRLLRTPNHFYPRFSTTFPAPYASSSTQISESTVYTYCTHHAKHCRFSICRMFIPYEVGRDLCSTDLLLYGAKKL